MPDYFFKKLPKFGKINFEKPGQYKAGLF